jgi:nucleotide-binding universal stress UspA family protein
MIDIKTVLVPVDFSEASKKAAKYGLTLAAQLNARLVLAHIVPDVTALTYSVPPESYALQQQQREAAGRSIQSIIPPEFVKKFDVETIVKLGDVETELLQTVKDTKADLVVLGTHGRRYPGRWFLGSVTEHILRKVPVPVVTVSHVEADAKQIELGLVAMRRLLFATDMTEESRIGLRYAVKLARTAGANLTVVYIAEQMDLLYWSGAVVGILERDRAKFLENLRVRLREFVEQDKPADLDIEELVLEGKPYEKILELAEDREMDMIVLNLQSKRLIDRAFLGATAERVVRLAKIPVFSVPVQAGK